MSVEEARQIFQSGQRALDAGELVEALEQAKHGLTLCHADDGDVHAALLDLQADVEAEIKKAERSKAEGRAASRVIKELSVNSVAAKQFAEKHARPSLRMHIEPSLDAGTIYSQFGGAPAVPKDFVWPKREDGRALSFLCQINLAEVHNFTFAHALLPKSGLLSFFYDTEDMPSGLDAGDRHGWCVYYFAKHMKVTPTEKIEGPAIPVNLAHFTIEPSYPDPIASQTEELEDDACSDYDRFTDSCYEDSPYHRLLGHPQLILGDFFEECEIASRGIEWQHVHDDEDLAAEVQACVKKWTLLLQLDSDERVDFSWGDRGMIYFCIEEDALKHHDFSNVWLIMQCR
jgi:uncharacterized protein YwqG